MLLKGPQDIMTLAPNEIDNSFVIVELNSVFAWNSYISFLPMKENAQLLFSNPYIFSSALLGSSLDDILP